MREIPEEGVEVVWGCRKVKPRCRRRHHVLDLPVQLWHACDRCWLCLQKRDITSISEIHHGAGRSRLNAENAKPTTNVDRRMPTGSLVCVILIVSSTSVFEGRVLEATAERFIREGKEIHEHTGNNGPALGLCIKCVRFQQPRCSRWHLSR